MIILSLIFLIFIGINIFWSSAKNKNIDDYMQDMQKQLQDELKIIK
ncbi:hypothetical protein ACUH7Y_16925 [Clostridium beijerinckii]|jgi:hypothetical protein|uniref:Nitrogen fixation-related uncharacterized protein n=2 Tax=Clostridium TaxID=1485 RepID=A0A1S8SMP7_CLOBE|nr:MULTISPECIES: hypothetical protein [Clostridium]MBA8934138.1 nitrogen fixation-related uncharacterized protein [Clostridium beijerinckii]MBN7576132.1 hypothetical protein [Clostridium beijerinckii]MBN7582115.1 hypothetical protein [Clostridium beijerinckii]MBN7585904.1 hypothetical protein [Clostridium beijerinckii]MBO0521772.1 hypothetical protein [Clostridium beijerinckii]